MITMLAFDPDNVEEFYDIVGILSEGILACSYNDDDIFRMLMRGPGVLNMEVHRRGSSLIDKSFDYEQLLLCYIKHFNGWPVNYDEATPLDQLPSEYEFDQEKMNQLLKQIDFTYLGYVELREKFTPTGDELSDFERKLTRRKFSIPVVIKDDDHDTVNKRPLLYYQPHSSQALVVSDFVIGLIANEPKVFEAFIMHVIGHLLRGLITDGVYPEMQKYQKENTFTTETTHNRCVYDKYIALFSGSETLFSFLNYVLSITEKYNDELEVEDTLARMEWHKQHLNDPDYLPVVASGISDLKGVDARNLEFIMHLRCGKPPV